MKKKKEYVLVTVIFIGLMILSQFALVSAITGSMGNARMVLYPEVNGLINTVIEKSILVKNVNDVPIDIKLEVDEGSTDFLEVVNEEFVLQPGEEKRAEFKVKVKDPGKYEGKINVFFSEAGDEKSGGVVLSSNIIVIAKNPNDSSEESEEENSENSESENPITGEVVLEDNKERNPIGIFLTITTAILIIVLIILFILSEKSRKKKVEEIKSKKREKINEKSTNKKTKNK
jgi:hypothetical protein